MGQMRKPRLLFPRMLSRILLVLGVVLLSVTAMPAVAHAGKNEDLTEARTRYKKGLDLYQDGAFDAALTEFQRAYDLAPSYKILYNIGLVQLELNDFAGALRSFKKYLDDGGKKVDQKRHAEVDKEIKKLEGRVASLEIKSNVESAEILVDDLEVGETPLEEPLMVNAGKRKITLSKSGYVPVTRVVVVAGGDSKKLELELRQGQASTPPTPLETKPATTGKTSETPHSKPVGAEPKRKVPWLWWGVTGGLAAGTAVAGVLTLGAQKDLNDKKDHPATKQALDDAAKKTRTLAVVTDVFLVGTLAVGGYATYLTFFKKPSDAQAEPGVSLSVGPGSVRVDGTFSAF
jgi:hypothetical protein